MLGQYTIGKITKELADAIKIDSTPMFNNRLNDYLTCKNEDFLPISIIQQAIAGEAVNILLDTVIPSITSNPNTFKKFTENPDNMRCWKDIFLLALKKDNKDLLKSALKLISGFFSKEKMKHSFDFSIDGKSALIHIAQAKAPNVLKTALDLIYSQKILLTPEESISLSTSVSSPHQQTKPK